MSDLLSGRITKYENSFDRKSEYHFGMKDGTYQLINLEIKEGIEALEKKLVKMKAEELLDLSEARKKVTELEEWKALYNETQAKQTDALEEKVKEFNDYMKCDRCGDYFNMGDLSRVAAHEKCPVMKVNYKSKKQD